MAQKWDFCGYATKNDIKCSDGRIIRRDAFKDCDGSIVPIVFQHVHNDAKQVLGHGLLENRDDGVYVYGSFNETDAGKNAKIQVDHGDIRSLSIYANNLKQQGANVIHGMIREVSLVLAGANPGAKIESLAIEHSDGSIVDLEDEAIIYSGEELAHAEEEAPAQEEKGENKMAEGKEKTVKEVFDTLNEEQKTVVYALIGQAIEDAKNEDSEENKDMGHNVFDAEEMENGTALSHADVESIFANAKKNGSLKDAYEDFALEHGLVDDAGNTIDYGIANIGYLFPDYKTVTNTPEFIKREDSWVSDVMSGVHHTPFTRIKSVFANITMDEARAKGYIKGNLKKNEVFSLLKRTTDPQTVYKKQQLDRDDITDITDFDVVAFIKNEMRGMLNEELARDFLIGDGRETSDNDHVSHDHIRPIWTDADLYSIKKAVTFSNNATEAAKAKEVIKAAVRARKQYKGSGNPILFTTEDWVTEMLLIEDLNGRVIYDTIEKLATAMRVRKIVTVPVFENQTRTYVDSSSQSHTMELIGIIVNLNDYNVGADKGGGISLFDDFNIDYNQYKYLIETRCSGALIKPYSAIVLETEVEAEIPEDDEE